MKMKKTYLVIWFSIFLLTAWGCQNLSDDKIEKKSIEDILGKKIENTSKMHMHLDISSNIAHIYNKEEIKKLEDLFNGAEFYETDEPKYTSCVDVAFFGKDGTTAFQIDEQDYIRLADDRYVKSKEIDHGKLGSIFYENVRKNREELRIIPEGKIESSLEEKIENSSEIIIGYLTNSYQAKITDQKEIKELEDLFNGAEFSKSDEPITPALLDITFYSKKDVTRFLISSNNVIVLENGMYAKSKEINFERIFSIIKNSFTKYQQKLLKY